MSTLDALRVSGPSRPKQADIPAEQLARYTTLFEAIQDLEALVTAIEILCTLYRINIRTYTTTDIANLGDPYVAALFMGLHRYAQDYHSTLAECTALLTRDLREAPPPKIKPWMDYFSRLDAFLTCDFRFLLRTLLYRRAGNLAGMCALPRDLLLWPCSVFAEHMWTKAVLMGLFFEEGRSADTQTRCARFLHVAEECMMLPEWSLFVCSVGYIWRHRYTLEWEWSQRLKKMQRRGVVLAAPVVAGFTVAATSAQAGSQCDICLEPYGGEDRAVTTRCGHTFGAQCLQRWADEHNNVCPLCRQNLRTTGEKFPGACQPYTRWIMRIVQRGRTLDAEIETWLDRGPQDIWQNPREFEPLMMKLSAVVFALHSATASLDKAISHEKGDRVRSLLFRLEERLRRT